MPKKYDHRKRDDGFGVHNHYPRHHHPHKKPGKLERELSHQRGIRNVGAVIGAIEKAKRMRRRH